jgi:aromatic-L-amino-acid decarboxylase
VGREDEPEVRELLDRRNAAIMDAVNRTGEVFLSHTRLAGRFTIRVAIGGIRTEARHVDRAWELLRREAARLDG